MEHIGLFLLTLYLGRSGVSAADYPFDADYLVPPKCRACDVKSCPLLTFCAGVVVKDQCGCCPRCSSDLFQPHVEPHKPPPAERPTASPPEPTFTSSGEACLRRRCPRFKMCVVNQQGLPICTCSSEFICQRRQTRRNNRNKEGLVAICGTDGVTYPSRCYLKVAYCNSKRRIKHKHDGACMTDEVTDVRGGKDTEKDKPVEAIINKIYQNYSEMLLYKQEHKRLGEEKRRELKHRREERQRENKKKKLGEQNNLRLRSRRMKRRNQSYNMFRFNNDMLFGRQTQWSSSQVRKSKI
ncbi:SPARC-like [Dreissena polymorpha]|uniref:Kazal-like domain-containing protein n=1 Tax=Dreissena polymorpha TaxID=45954 RepID=A0A9D4LCV3_DREPO|nr:SPARC-like [Dreissena polymorpha]KAH3854832.1 hypothetical protein DPMN_097383 [Dreissena polymorpha]